MTKKEKKEMLAYAHNVLCNGSWDMPGINDLKSVERDALMKVAKALCKLQCAHNHAQGLDEKGDTA